MARVSPKVMWSVPDLDGRVLTGQERKARWRALGKQEKQWVREAVAHARRHPEPELQALVAAYAWRQLVLLPAYAIGAVVLSLALDLAFALGGVGGGGGTAPVAVVAILLTLHARRHAAALAQNIGPPGD